MSPAVLEAPVASQPQEHMSNRPLREPIEAIIERIAKNAERAVTARPHLSIRRVIYLIRRAYAGEPVEKVSL
jgi:hypothetical protein